MRILYTGESVKIKEVGVFLSLGVWSEVSASLVLERDLMVRVGFIIAKNKYHSDFFLSV